jgi:predicted  nucleic acid-binding Zn-ribbon protein
MLHKCTRCGGQVIESYSDTHCLNCGYNQLPIITITDKIELERLLDQRATKRLDSRVKEKEEHREEVNPFYGKS